MCLSFYFFARLEGRGRVEPHDQNTGSVTSAVAITRRRLLRQCGGAVCPPALVHFAAVTWLTAYGFDTDDTPASLGSPATLTVVLRDLDNDRRTYEFLPIEPAASGEEQREAILRAMAGRFPDALWKTYNADKQIASFVGRQHLYIAIYEEHDIEAVPEERPTLFAV